MFKYLILFALIFNTAFAKDRFTEADKTKFLTEVKQSIAEFKLENGGKIDLQIMKPELFKELDEYHKLEKFTQEELLVLKQNYELFSKKNIPQDKVESEFLSFIDGQLSQLNKIPLKKTGLGEVCNKWGCEDGLKCAPATNQVNVGKFKIAGATCKEDNECASQECVEETAGSKKKVCEAVFKCFKPLGIGQSCNINPVCSEGSCLSYNSMTSGIGECDKIGRTCKSNLDCCSNLCEQGRCQVNKICKDCVQNGMKPQRGQKCCEGLFKNTNGVCIPDLPPSVIDQVNNQPKNLNLSSMLLDLIFNSAHAQGDGGPSDPAPVVSEPVPAAPAPEPQANAKATAEMKGYIESNSDKFENFQSDSATNSSVNFKDKKANINFKKQSNFETCDIHFKEDFYNSMKADKTFDLEVAMLAFDFVSTGESVDDHWTKGSNSIHSRLKAIGTEHIKIRKKTHDKIAGITKKLTCMCLDVKGYKKIDNENKKKFFEDSCEEYAKYKDPTLNYDDTEGDASGIKAKRLLTTWSTTMTAFHTSLQIDNNSIMRKLSEISTWANNDAKWNESTQKHYELFKYNVENPQLPAITGLLSAVLAAGVIAVLGGFASSSILSAWAAAAIITASALTGAGGVWMLASLKGAWITHRPQITDYHVQPRYYSCGKKSSCMEFSRFLVQPYNNVCRKHVSANACVKNFVVVEEGDQFRYIVDPWIPAENPKKPRGLKNMILGNQPVYTDVLEEGFENARKFMTDKNPGASGGGGKKGGGQFVAQSYMTDVFIDAEVVGKYAPNFERLGGESVYLMTKQKVDAIKDAAKDFAIAEGFLTADDEENLKEFADYAYEYHFVWPKKSRENEISYPTVGLTSYLSFMANDVSAKMNTGLTTTTGRLSTLAASYLSNLIDTMQIYKDTNMIDAAKKEMIQADIDGKKQELAAITTFNSMLNNKSLGTSLSNISAGQLSGSINGIDSNALGLLNADQKQFLKNVGDLRKKRLEQLNELNNYKKEMAANGNADRAAKVSKVSKSFSSKFATGNAAFGDSKLGSIDSSNSKDNSSNTAGYAPFSYKAPTQSDSYGGNFGMGNSFGKKENKNTAESDSGVVGGSQEDSKKLADAIEARDRDKSKYESQQDGVSLFEQVTNAYIRNYDKVLIRKKDKDVVEQKKQ
jgi:hypothetical protein